MADPTSSVRVQRASVLLAGALDQLVLLAVVVLAIGVGLLLSRIGVAAGLATGVAIVGGLVSWLGAATLQVVLAVRTGRTAGLRMLGLRFDARAQVRWDDAAEWLMLYWRDLLLVVLTGPLLRGLRADDPSEAPAVVRDTRVDGLGRARTAVASLLVVSCAPLAVALVSGP